MKKNSQIVYCDNNECKDHTCARWIENAPWDELISVFRYRLNKHGYCKERVGK